MVDQEGMHVTVHGKAGEYFLFSGGPINGQLKTERFKSLFSPFRPNEIVFHSHYGIGQVVPSPNPHVNSAVKFFSEPTLFDIDESIMRPEYLTRLIGG